MEGFLYISQDIFVKFNFNPSIEFFLLKSQQGVIQVAQAVTSKSGFSCFQISPPEMKIKLHFKDP